MPKVSSDSIYGLATPDGRSAISVIRITGSNIPKAFYSFVSLDGAVRSTSVKSLVFDKFSDRCLLLNFPGPGSYTGENLIEIHCHGNPVIVSEICLHLEEMGIREAEPGEFSKRAFLNNKLTLDQAEAISLGIEARSLQDLISLDSFRSGALGIRVEEILGACEHLLVQIESQLDFSDEEDVTEISKEDILEKRESIINLMGGLLEGYRPVSRKQLIHKIVLVGKPNVGKSSLFNVLVGDDVAIVANEPGTTRDVVRHNLFLGSYDFEIEDTAGVRKASSNIEKMGIDKTTKAVEGADVLVWVSDLEDMESSRPVCDLWVGNKSDKVNKNINCACDVVVSAKTGVGIDELKELLKEKIKPKTNISLVSERIYKKLLSGFELLKQSSSGDDFYESSAHNLREVLVLLKEIYGDFDNDKILDEIFSNFCIGK